MRGSVPMVGLRAALAMMLGAGLTALPGVRGERCAQPRRRCLTERAAQVVDDPGGVGTFGFVGL